MRLVLALALAASLTAADSDYQKFDERAMYGINMAPTSATAQQREGLDPYQGVEVQTVYAGTAADRAGIKPGDVVLSFNGGDIGSMNDLRNEVALAGVGGPAGVVVSRNGERIVLNETLSEWPKNIPYQPIDEAAERRFRDWQARRLDRTQQAVANLKKQIEDLERGAAAPQAAKPGSLAEAMAMPASQALAGMPAFRLTLRVDHDAKQHGAVVTADQTWDARVLIGSPAPEIL